MLTNISSRWTYLHSWNFPIFSFNVVLRWLAFCKGHWPGSPRQMTRLSDNMSQLEINRNSANQQNQTTVYNKLNAHVCKECNLTEGQNTIRKLHSKWTVLPQLSNYLIWKQNVWKYLLTTKKRVHGPCHFKVLYFRVLFVPYEKLIFRVAELSTILRFSEMWKTREIWESIE